MPKTIQEINDKIRKGQAVIVTAKEMKDIVSERGPEKAAKEVDVVTTGTFGAMCSSGAFLNFGHADPPIKMQKVWLNDVEAYTGLAAVDAYIGATELSISKGMEYGGGHVIEDLIAGKEVQVKATAYGTDCYPTKYIETAITLEDINQAIMFNPRNAYQRYNAATNTTDRTLYTYMGTLLPNMKNINYAGTGEISPLNNDPTYKTIGVGTRIFLGGTQGYVASEGTQHNPKSGFGNLAVTGNLKRMSLEYIRGAVIPKYGTSLFVGIGIPIPILNEEIAKATAVRNSGLKTGIFDYGVPRLQRPLIREVTYEELMSGEVEVKGVKVKTAPLSSQTISVKITKALKKWIEAKEFYLTEPADRLPQESVFKPMKMKSKTPPVSEVMSRPVITIGSKGNLAEVSNLLVEHSIDQVPVVDDEERLLGIITSWDITKATAEGKFDIESIMTTNVIHSKPNESLEEVSRKLEKYSINATPVIDEQGKVVGIITLTDINKVYRRMQR